MAGDNRPQQYLRYDPERTDWAVSEAELEILERGNSPLWKDVFLVSLPLAATTLFNAYGEGMSQTGKTLEITLPIFINSIIGVVSIGFVLLSGVAWYRSKTSFKAVIERIKNKPKYPIPPGTFPTKEDQQADPQRRTRKKKAKQPSSSSPEIKSPPESKTEDPTQKRTDLGSPSLDESEGGEQ